MAGDAWRHGRLWVMLGPMGAAMRDCHTTSAPPRPGPAARASTKPVRVCKPAWRALPSDTTPPCSHDVARLSPTRPVEGAPPCHATPRHAGGSGLSPAPPRRALPACAGRSTRMHAAATLLAPAQPLPRLLPHTPHWCMRCLRCARFARRKETLTCGCRVPLPAPPHLYIVPNVFGISNSPSGNGEYFL